MKILLGLVIIEMIVLYIKSKGLYTEALSEIDKKDYPIKGILPIGLYFMEMIKYWNVYG
jgi:tight adherence protein C